MNLIFKIENDKTKEEVVNEIATQLNLISNSNLINKIKSYLLDPTLHFAIWDYSKGEDKYPVWLILASEKHDTGILYSEYGFEFGNWGLIKLSDNPYYFGMDSQWFEKLENAFLDSWMSEEE